MYVQKGDKVKIKGEVLGTVTKVISAGDDVILQVSFQKKRYTPDEVYLIRNMPNAT